MGSKERHQTSSKEKNTPWKKGVALFGALGAIGLGVAWANLDKSGDIERINPIKPSTELVDNLHVQLDWNMHNETYKRRKQIKSLIKRYQVDAVTLQEVSKKDVKPLAEYLSDFYVRYAVGDAKSKILDNGLGNMIITKQKPRDVKSLSLPGSGAVGTITNALSGFKEDVAHARPKLESTGKSWRSDRSTLAMTISVKQGNELKDLRLINGHIDGDDRVQLKQFNMILGFVKSNNEENRPTIFCGDLNYGPGTVTPAFTEGLGFIPLPTAKTSENGKEAIDYCYYTTDKVLDLGSIAVLSNPHTDHYPLLAKWPTRP